MRALIFTFLLLPSLAAGADAPTTRVVSGLQAGVDEDGKLIVDVHGPVLLSDGRKIEMKEGRWTVDPEAPSGIRTVSAIDFAVYGRDYIGKRVKVVGGTFSGVDASYGQLVLPGGRVVVRFDDMARDSVKTLVENCSSFVPVSNRVCTVNVIGTVRAQRFDNKPEIVEPVLETPASAPLRVR